MNVSVGMQLLCLLSRYKSCSVPKLQIKMSFTLFYDLVAGIMEWISEEEGLKDFI